MITATKRPIYPAAAYPANLPQPGATTSSGFSVKDTTLLYAGSVGVKYSKSPIGWLPQLRQRVTGGFDDALAAAKLLARTGAEATEYTPPGQSTKTHLAAVLLDRDGTMHVAPVFVQSFNEKMRLSAFGTSLWRQDEFMPGTRSTVLALAGPKSWIDARPPASSGAD